MLTFSETVAMVNDIIAEKPEGYKYTKDPKTAERRAQYPPSEKSGTDCYYAHADGTPGCIVGNFIHKLNPEFDLKSIEHATVGYALRAADIRADEDSHQLLSDCQNFQDNGESWAAALEGAVRISHVGRSLV
jgi:hypothetical protein